MKGVILPFVVPPSGVGFKDWNLSVDNAVEPLARTNRHQERLMSAATFTGLATLAYPFVYWLVIGWFTRNDIFTWSIPSDVDSYITHIVMSGQTAATSIAGVAIVDNIDASFNPVGTITTIAQKFAPREAELIFTNPINITQYAGKYLIVPLAHYGVNPAEPLSITVHAIKDAAPVSLATNIAVP